MEDKFEKFLQGKLNEDHVPFKEEYWGEMEKLLDRKKKRKPLFIWWFSGAGLVVFASLIFIFWPVGGDSGNAENDHIVNVRQLPEIAMEKEEFKTVNAKTESPVEPNSSDEVMTGSRGAKQKNTLNDPVKNSKVATENKEVLRFEINSVPRAILDVEKKSETHSSGVKFAGNELTGQDEDLMDGSSAPINASISEAQDRIETDIGSGEISGESIIIRTESIEPVESGSEININYAIPIENIPEPKITGPWSLGLQAGLVAYTETFDKNTFTMIGPTAGVVIARNIVGPYRLMGAVNYSTFKLDDRNVQSLSEPAYGFGKEERMRSMIASRVHLVDVPVSISRKIGPLWMDLGGGVEWLTGIRGSIRDEYKIPDYSLANRVFVERTESNEEAIWMEDNSISNFRGFVSMGINMPIGRNFEFGVSGRYYFSEMGSSSGNDFEVEIIEGNTRMFLSGSVKYWIK